MYISHFLAKGAIDVLGYPAHTPLKGTRKQSPDFSPNANRYGTPKNKNEQIFVGHFVGSNLWEQKSREQKKRKCFSFVCFFVGLCFSLWPQKTLTYGTVHVFRSTVQNLSLKTRCAQGRPHFQIDVLTVGLIFKLMCPRWASYSN